MTVEKAVRTYWMKRNRKFPVPSDDAYSEAIRTLSAAEAAGGGRLYALAQCWGVYEASVGYVCQTAADAVLRWDLDRAEELIGMARTVLRQDYVAFGSMGEEADGEP